MLCVCCRETLETSKEIVHEFGAQLDSARANFYMIMAYIVTSCMSMAHVTMAAQLELARTHTL